MPPQIPTRCAGALRLLLLLGWLLFGTWTAPCAAQDPPTPEEKSALLERLRAAAASVRSIDARFVQTRRLAVFVTEMHSSGRMQLQKPDKLRWEYLEPSASGFLVNGGQAMRWSELLPEPQRFAIDEDPATQVVAGQLLAWATVDLPRLERDFRLEVTHSDPPVLRLTPHGERLRNYLEGIVIHFAPDLRTVQLVEILEKDGDSSELRFDEVQVNQSLPEDAFR